MTGREIIKATMEYEGVSNIELAREMGLSAGTMWARLNGKVVKDISLTSFCNMLDKMGYEVVVRKRGSESTPEKVVTFEDSALEEHRGGDRYHGTPGPD